MPAGRRAEVPLPVQVLNLDRLLPGGRSCLSPVRLVWTGPASPGSGCGIYQVRLEAQPASPPSITVIHPPLRPNYDGLLPHVYTDGSLCVSQRGDWRPHMLFTDTFIPWTCEWLVYYELWVATGTWYGDGDDLDMLSDESQARVLHEYRAPSTTATSGLRCSVTQQGGAR